MTAHRPTGDLQQLSGARSNVHPGSGRRNLPEYTLLSKKVVFVIIGRSSAPLIPLAENIDFRVHKNELAVRIDDDRHESNFVIKEMVLRTQWDLVQKHMEPQAAGSAYFPPCDDRHTRL